MASSEWPKARSRHHQRRFCNPCFICGMWQPRYDHFCALTKEEQRFIQQHFGREIHNDSCMCRGHVKEAHRHRSDPDYTPVWKKNTQHAETQMRCVFPQCTATSLRERIITPSGDMQTLFNEQLNVPKPVVCEMHYQHLYRILHMQNPCAGCGAKPKSRQGV